MEPVRILLVTSDPDGYGERKLHIPEHLNTMDNFCKQNNGRVDVKPLLATTLSTLSTQCLEYRPHILQFMTHGEADTIILHEDQGSHAREVTIRDIMLVFEAIDSLRLVMFNCCNSSEWVHPIIKQVSHLQCVIAWPNTVPDNLTTRFAKTFYDKFVILDTPLRTALNLAKNDLPKNGKIPQPVYVAGQGVNLDQIFWQDLNADAKRSAKAERSPATLELRVSVKELSILIDRPAQAFNAILEALKRFNEADHPPVQALLYLSEDFTKDQPESFCYASAVRLRSSNPHRHGADLIEILESGRIRKNMAIESGWVDLAHGSLSHDACYDAILEKLDTALHDASALDSEEKRRKIAKLLRQQKSYKVLCCSLVLDVHHDSVFSRGLFAVLAWLRIMPYQDPLIQLAEWIEDWNAQWAQITDKSQHNSGLLLLFFVKTPLSEKKRAVRAQWLENIKEQNVIDWCTRLNSMLDRKLPSSRQALENSLEDCKNAIRARLNNHYPVTYTDFKKHCEDITSHD